MKDKALKKESYKEDGLEKVTKILVLLNNKATKESAMSNLEIIQEDITFTSSLDDFLEKIPLVVPDLVLLSWNVKYVDIMKLNFLLTQELGIGCAVFAEHNDEDTVIEMIESKISHLLLPPLTAEGLKQELELILWEREALSETLDSSGKIIFLPPKPKVQDFGSVIKIVKERINKWEKVFQDEEKFIEIDPSEDLILESQVAFDIFINMPQNHKRILYLKAGSILKNDHLEKLLSFGAHRVFIQKK
jgi:hypothetical protein